MRSTPLSPRSQALATLPMTAAVSAALSATALLLPSTASAQLEEVVVTARARAVRRIVKTLFRRSTGTRRRSS